MMVVVNGVYFRRLHPSALFIYRRKSVVRALMAVFWTEHGPTNWLTECLSTKGGEQGGVTLVYISESSTSIVNIALWLCRCPVASCTHSSCLLQEYSLFVWVSVCSWLCPFDNEDGGDVEWMHGQAIGWGRHRAMQEENPRRRMPEYTRSSCSASSFVAAAAAVVVDEQAWLDWVSLPKHDLYFAWTTEWEWCVCGGCGSDGGGNHSFWLPLPIHPKTDLSLTQ